MCVGDWPILARPAAIGPLARQDGGFLLSGRARALQQNAQATSLAGGPMGTHEGNRPRLIVIDRLAHG
jgi:hypothetical protein